MNHNDLARSQGSARKTATQPKCPFQHNACRHCSTSPTSSTQISVTREHIPEKSSLPNGAEQLFRRLPSLLGYTITDGLALRHQRCIELANGETAVLAMAYLYTAPRGANHSKYRWEDMEFAISAQIALVLLCWIRLTVCSAMHGT